MEVRIRSTNEATATVSLGDVPLLQIGSVIGVIRREGIFTEDGALELSRDDALSGQIVVENGEAYYEVAYEPAVVTT